MTSAAFTINKINHIWSVFEQCEATSSRTAKTQLLQDCKVKNPSGDLGMIFDAVCNPFRTYGISPQPSYPSTGEIDEITSFTAFMILLQLLQERQLTGSAAQDELYKILSKSTPQTTKWLSRILLKDLRIGVARGTVDALFPGMVPWFEEQMLCVDLEINEIDSFIQRHDCTAEPKLDGVRCAFVKNANSTQWKILSRGGHEFYNCDHIVRELNKIIPASEAVVMDGELFCKSLRYTLSVARKEEFHPDAPSMVFFVWDQLTFAEWNGVDRTPLSTRRLRLNKFDTEDSRAAIRRVLHTPIKTSKELAEFMNKCLAAGFEGSVLKNNDSAYVRGERKNWVKVKPIYTDEVVITGYEVGKGKNAGVLGAFIIMNDKALKQKYPKAFTAAPGEIVCNVGGGFTDVERAKFWADRDQMIGKRISVEYKMITDADKTTGKRALREPVFLAVRDYE